MKVALYCRVSTEEQAKFGLSIQAQLLELREFSLNNKYTIVGEYLDEGVSGGRIDRPALNKLLEDVKQDKIDLILFVKLDRWFRSVAHYYKIQEILEKHNVEWKAIQEEYETQTSSGKFKVNIMLSVNQQFKDATSERIKSVFDYKVFEKKEHPNGCKNKILGYDTINKKYVINEKEAIIVNELFDKFYHTQSLVEVLDYYNNNYGHTTLASIKSLLKRETYCGRYTYKGHTFEDFFPRIVSDEDFNKVQNIFSRNCKKYTNKSNEKRTFIFTSLLTCCDCGGRLNGIATGSASNRELKVKYYRCKQHYINHNCSNNRLYPEKKIEKELLESLPILLEKTFEYDKKVKEKKIVDNSAKIKEKMNRLQRLFVDDIIDIDNYNKQYNELKKELELSTPIVKQSNVTIDEVKSILDMYNSLNEESKRLFWRCIPFKIKVKNDTFYLEEEPDYLTSNRWCYELVKQNISSSKKGDKNE